MAKTLREWVTDDIGEVAEKSVSWLSQYHFFRDPSRPMYVDSQRFFSPADGVLVYQGVVLPGARVIDIKGRPYTLREALRDDSFDQPCLVVGIFMTFFDVHVNRVPYSGRLSYREFEPLDTINRPMLKFEKDLLERCRIVTDNAEYLWHNQRMVNRVDAPDLGQSYYVLQIADYDVDSITPFNLKQNQPVKQGERFSQIRYGSQVDLIIPLSERCEFIPLQQVGAHVEGGVDPLVAVVNR